MTIKWLVGKSSAVDILWAAYKNKITTNPQVIRTINLFEEIKYKYVFNKKTQNFFKQDHKKFGGELIIKGITTIDDEIMHKTSDEIWNVDKMSHSDIVEKLCLINQIVFNQDEQKIVKTQKNIEDIATLIILKELEINPNLWQKFLTPAQENWPKQLREGSLLRKGILNPVQIIPILNYIIAAKKSAPLIFINGKIKQGCTLWELSETWKSALKN